MNIAETTWTELASRSGNGLEVTLLWSTSSGRVKVAVEDSTLDQSFEIHVAGAEALAAYHHPFAHAASEDRRPGSAACTTTQLQLQS